MVTVFSDLPSSVVTRQDRPSVAAVTPASAEKPTLETPTHAVTGVGEIITPSSERRDVDAETRRDAKSPDNAQVPEEEAAETKNSDGPKDPDPVFSRRFESDFVYDQGYHRTFTDLTLTTRDEVTLRIPSENYVRRLNETVESMTGRSDEPNTPKGDGVDVDA